jgi:hypothetical protein
MFLRLPFHQCQDRERFAETARIDLFYLALPLPLAFRLLPYGLSVTSRSIGQSLADCTLNRAGGPLNVIYRTDYGDAETNAIIRNRQQQDLELQGFAVILKSVHDGTAK